MAKSNSTQSRGNLFIAIFAIAAAVLLIFTPILFFDFGTTYGDGIMTVWGFQAIFGTNETMISAGDKMISCDFNWQLYIALLLVLVTGITTNLIGPKHKGYYIFGAILFVLCAIMVYASAAWTLNATIHATNIGADTLEALCHLGVGPWLGGLLIDIAAILCIVQYKTADLR